MAYKYKHFIPQNTAPNGAKNITVYDRNGNKIASIALGRLNRPTKDKKYSFGLVSDIHLWDTEPSWNANTKFDNALSHFAKEGCAFCVVSGDLTQSGFYKRTEEYDASTTYYDTGQLAEYERICNDNSIPVYELSGNHESYYDMYITNNLDKWDTYTGESALHYSFVYNNDLFVMLGQPNGTTPMSDDALNWLSGTLEANKDGRSFIFVHPPLSSGNPQGAYTTNPIFDWWGEKTTTFENLLKQYPNTILFHGHTHTKFECQEVDPCANYADGEGYKSVHVPSLSRPRNVVNGTISAYIDTESQGYIVDVYSDCIVLNGMDFINNVPVPLGTYKITV